MDVGQEVLTISKQLDTIFSLLGSLAEEQKRYIASTEQVRHLVPTSPTADDEKSPPPDCPMMGHLMEITTGLRRMIANIREANDTLAL